MGGAGGPINRIDLRTRKVSPILNRNDPRMPNERRYLYFPMISRDGRFFAFAASPNQHDHFRSDYDVFVARLNPENLEVVDRPVRYTFHGKNDRFPDVYVAELALGQFAGEAPYAVELAVKGSRDEWSWDFGDGQTARGRQAKHAYRKPGEYRVSARQGKRLLRGLVRVSAAAPPKPLTAWLAKPDELTISFDEPIRLDGLQAQLESGLKTRKATVVGDGAELVLHLAGKLTKKDVLRLSGVTDQAQRPNAMAPARLEVAATSWPARKDGLVFLFQTAEQPNLAAGADGRQRSFGIEPRGRARLNRYQGLVLTGGAYLVKDADGALLDACRKSGQLTIEALIAPDHLKQNGPAQDRHVFVQRGRTQLHPRTARRPPGFALAYALHRKQRRKSGGFALPRRRWAATARGGDLSAWRDGLLPGRQAGLSGPRRARRLEQLVATALAAGRRVGRRPRLGRRNRRRGDLQPVRSTPRRSVAMLSNTCIWSSRGLRRRKSPWKRN